MNIIIYNRRYGQFMVNKRHTYKFKLTYTNKMLSCKDPNSAIKRQRSIKMHLNKCNISLNSVAKTFGLNIRKCNFCNNNCNNFSIISSVTSNEMYIDDIVYTTELFYCYEKSCPAKKLNGNSVEFVSNAYNISEKAALKKIHDRNNTPFYKENHNSEADYKQFQSSAMMSENRCDIIQKQIYSRSLGGYIQNYGKSEGTLRWKECSRRKGITLGNMQRKWGEEDGKFRYMKWKAAVVNTEDNFIKRHGQAGKEKYRQYVDKVTRNSLPGYGIQSFTDEGYILRSNLERKFYECMKLYSLHHESYEVDKMYPTSTLRFDFLFKDVKLIVEICGMRSDEYAAKIKVKELLARETGYDFISIWDTIYFDKDVLKHCKLIKDLYDNR